MRLLVWLDGNVEAEGRAKIKRKFGKAPLLFERCETQMVLRRVQMRKFSKDDEAIRNLSPEQFRVTQ